MSQNKKIFIKTIVSFIGTGIVAFAFLFFAGVSTVEAVPTIQFTATSSSAAESVTPASLELILSATSSSEITVDYALTGTATGGGADYTASATGTATITAGNSTTTIPIVIVDDTLYENDETIIATISNPANSTLGANTVHTYTIIDNDTAPTIQFTATSSSAAESVTPASLELVLSAVSGLTVTVDYALTGTATGGGADYTASATGTATITVGNSTTTIPIVIVDDTLYENDETIIATISNPANSTLGANTVHTYTIIDNDTAPIGGGGWGGQPMPITATGQVTATPSAGGKTTLTTPEGTKATVELPAGAVTSDTVVKIEKVETGTIIIASPTPTGKTIVSAFNFTAIVGGTAVTSFAKSVTITITYTDAQVAGLNEANLKIYRWDGTQWLALPSVVNTATNTITATTTSFSYVAVMGDSLLVKPITEMTVSELRAEIVRITALIAQLQSQIAQLQAGVTIPSLCQGITFDRNLSQGAVGNDVKCLQALLNQSPDTKIAVSGVGSPGRETNYFGVLTRAAVIKFQEKYRAEILTPLGLTAGTGFVGSSSRAELNKILGR